MNLSFKNEDEKIYFAKNNKLLAAHENGIAHKGILTLFGITELCYQYRL